MSLRLQTHPFSFFLVTLTRAKVEALEKKAAKAFDEAKVAIEARIEDFEERLKKSLKEFDKLLTGKELA